MKQICPKNNVYSPLWKIVLSAQNFSITTGRSTPKVRKQILEAIAKLPIQAVVFVVDTQGRRVTDTPENYGIVIGFSIVEVLKYYKTLILTVDKKFTNLKDQGEVEKVALQIVAKNAEKGILDFKSHADSKNNSLLQLVDFIAGAYNYKFNLKDETYWNVIKKIIIEEKRENWMNLKASIKKNS